jgi:lipopolysaccharide transport system permease protein
MQAHPTSPAEMVASAWRNRSLILALIQRDVIGRYRGSMLGALWSFFHPLLMLAIYTFVFSVAFGARWSAGGDSKAEFAIVLFAGLLVFNLFSECVNRAPTTIVANTNFVKKVVFPLEILPWVVMGSALFHALISLIVWLVFYAILLGLPHPSACLLPLVIFPLVLFTMGISWLLASLGVYLRDVTQVVGIGTTALLFLSPIFYPASSLPEQYRWLLAFNPMTPSIEQARDVLVWGRAPDWTVLGTTMAAASVIAWLGFAWFQRTRKGFADVL